MDIYGADPNALPIHVPIQNDTGSNAQTLLLTDLVALRCDPYNYLGIYYQVVETPAGNVTNIGVRIEIPITADDGVPLTPWYLEVAVVNPTSTVRLSGAGMRQHLFFATAPGNGRLYVAVTKSGVVSQLPVVSNITSSVVATAHGGGTSLGMGTGGFFILF